MKAFIFTLCIILFELYAVQSYGNHQQDQGDFYPRCVNDIYRQCKHRHEFSEQEVENARIYLQNRYYKLANPAYRPLRPPCKKLQVRKDFKCMSHNERLELINAIQELYRNGVAAHWAKWPHTVYYGQTNKFGDFFPVHRWYPNVFEKELQKINPKLTIPYWNPYEEFDHPEYGIQWDYLGRAGNNQSQYCVLDGAFANVKPCVKRHWVNDSAVRSWNPNEYVDAQLQSIDELGGFFQWNTNAHFKVHLAVGGYEGQMTLPPAPYDFSFYTLHVWLLDVQFLKWQLQSDAHLMPTSYNGGVVYDWEIDRVRPSNITRDILIYFNVSVEETFQVGFGELCSIPDVMVEDINNVINGRRMEMPAHYKRMPKALLQKYFPKFYAGNYTPFDFLSYNVSECNRMCKPIRQTQDFAETREGLGLYERFRYLALLNIAEAVENLEPFPKQFITDLNTGGYCSPYVIN